MRFLAALLLCLSAPAVAGEPVRWYWVATGDGTDIIVDGDSIASAGGTERQAWSRLMSGSRQGRRLSLDRFGCVDRTSVALALRVYDERGVIVEAQNYSGPALATRVVPPGTMWSDVLNFVCASTPNRADPRTGVAIRRSPDQAIMIADRLRSIGIARWEAVILACADPADSTALWPMLPLWVPAADRAAVDAILGWSPPPPN